MVKHFAESQTIGKEKDDSISHIINKRSFLLFLAIAYFAIPFIEHISHILAGEIPVSGDGLLGVFNMIYTGESIKDFDFPLWTPYLAGGKPFAEDVALNIMYPPFLLCSLLPNVLQLYAYFGIHYAMGGIAMYAFLKRINCKLLPSVVVSTIYLFTAHMGGIRKDHIALIIAALYLPIVLYLIERWLQEEKIRWLLLGSLAMAMQFYGGFLQYVVYSDIFFFFYTVCSCIYRRFPIKKIITCLLIWLSGYFGLVAAGALPLAQLLLFLAQSKGEAMSVEMFTSLSLHPVKLLMTVFPLFFGSDIWGSLLSIGNYSSGMDIELFMGAIAVTLIISGVFGIKNNFHMRFMKGSLIVLILYMCLGQMDVLTSIVYHIPILNMFRIPSRCIFIFTFVCMVVLALSVNAIYSSEEHMQRIRWVNCFFTGVLIIFIVLYPFITIQGMETQMSVSEVFGVPAGLYGLYLFVFYICKRLKQAQKINKNTFSNVISLTLLVTTIVQLVPYHAKTRYSDFETTLFYPTEALEDIGSYKLWMKGDVEEATANQTLIYHYPTLNSYTNFNLPNLNKLINHTNMSAMNYSGLYKYFPYIEKSLYEDNDLVSMLGVKYIMTSSETDLDGCMPIQGYEKTNDTLIQADKVSLYQADGYRYAIWTPVRVEDDCYYRISFDMKAPTLGEQFYVDFCADGYDNEQQNAWFRTLEGEHSYEAFIPSGTCGAKDKDVQFRIIYLGVSDIEMKNLMVEKVKPYFMQVYDKKYENEFFNVYVNNAAKPIVYTPSYVKVISDQEKEGLYLNTKMFDILNTSYITDAETNYDLTDAQVEISDITLTNNCVSAFVSAQKEAFVNMSQTYYPGWNAYIDGKKTKVYEVNGLIQGTFIPAGEHLVEFKYQPTVFFVGLAISFITLVGCIAVTVYSERKNKERNKP